MTPKKQKTKQEDKSKALSFLKKAEYNFNQMRIALEEENFNAAGTLAVQCAISSADAICVYEKGARSISPDHFDACELVQSITLREAKEKSGSLRRIIAKKNLIQYESRSISKPEAQDIVKKADRFYKWVQSVIEG